MTVFRCIILALVSASPALAETAMSRFGKVAADASIVAHGTGSPIVDLFSARVPPNYNGDSAAGAIFSFCLPNSGCVPGDHERTAHFHHTTSAADASVQEFDTFLQMDAVTGKAPFWTAGTAFQAGSQMVHGANLYETTAACTTAASGSGPTGTGTAIPDGTCSWSYVTHSIANGKTALGVDAYSGVDAGSTWGAAIAMQRVAGDPTRFTATAELDTDLLDTVDHVPGTSAGAAYGVIQSGFGSGIGSVGYAMSTANVPQGTTLGTTAGSVDATVSSAYGIYPYQRVMAAGVPMGTTIVSMTGTSIVLSRPATTTGSVTASLVTPMWHWGFAVMNPNTASDFGFLNSSNARDGFFNNGANADAGFLDQASAAPFGFRAAGHYTTAAIDTTAATTPDGLRLNADQGVTFKAGDWTFQYVSAVDLFTLTVAGAQPWYIDTAGHQYATAFRAGSGGFNAPLRTPGSSSAACTAGDFADDADYHYVCVATNTWKRVALSSF